MPPTISLEIKSNARATTEKKNENNLNTKEDLLVLDSDKLFNSA